MDKPLLIEAVKRRLAAVPQLTVEREQTNAYRYKIYLDPDLWITVHDLDVFQPICIYARRGHVLSSPDWIELFPYTRSGEHQDEKLAFHKLLLAYIAEAQRLYGEYVFDSILTKLKAYEHGHP